MKYFSEDYLVQFEKYFSENAENFEFFKCFCQISHIANRTIGSLINLFLNYF